MVSEWRAIPGWEGFYEVSSEGSVRSRWRTLRPTANRDGYLVIGLRRDGDQTRAAMTVHKIVMGAFVGPCPKGHEVRHLDGDPTNNRLTNLAYGTRRENNLDAVRHGTNQNTAKTHCNHGHEFTPDNTYQYRTSRICRACQSVRRARYEAKRSAA